MAGRHDRDDPCAAQPPRRPGRSSIGKLAEAVDTFNNADVEFITHLGDFVDRFERSLAELLPTFEKARRAKYHVLGNHDFQLPTAQLLDVLDMPAPYYHAVGAEQLAWLLGVLANARRRGEKVVLSSHHPVFPKNAHNAWNDDELLELIDRFDNVIARHQRLLDRRGPPGPPGRRRLRPRARPAAGVPLAVSRSQ